MHKSRNIKTAIMDIRRLCAYSSSELYFQTNSSHLRKTTNNITFNSTLTHLDTEITVLTPILVPTVRDLPVLNTILNTPTNQLHSVSTEIFSRNMLIDSALVRHEILVHIEGDFHRSFRHELHLNLIDSMDRVSSLEHMLVLFVSLGISLLTLLHTLRSRLGLTTRRILASAVMLTLREGISIAPIRRSILSSSRHSSLMEPVPSSSGETSVATESACIATCQQIFLRKTILIRSLRRNTKTIRSSLNGAESPARTTHRLVTNLLDGRTFGPVLSSIEGFGKILANNNILHGELISTLQGTNILGVIAGRNSLVSNPSSVKRIDLLSHLNESRRMSEGNSQNSEDDSTSHIRLQSNTDAWENKAKTPSASLLPIPIRFLSLDCSCIRQHPYVENLASTLYFAVIIPLTPS